MLEPGESLVDAVKREVAEEAGIVVEPRGVLCVEHLRYVTGMQQPVEKMRHIVIASVVSGVLKTVPDAESLRAGAFSLEEAASLRLREPGCLTWLEMACNGGALFPFDRYAFRLV
jgi:ADP-ribose pyrophosphatase YjhB (NUDIX family)